RGAELHNPSRSSPHCYRITEVVHFGPKIPIEGKRSKKRATGVALSVPTEFHSGGSLENRERSSLRTARRTPVVDELDFRTLFPYRWAD
ncbi:MAG: hypothetical protein WBW16_09365, partial [Bacteroidota bacterium]